jgi:hypothetical protein
MRTKIITLDGAEYKIRSLTMREAEEFFQKLQKAVAGSENGKTEQLTKLWEGLVALVLVSPEVKVEQVETQLDIVSFKILRDEILKFSGFDMKEESPGEATASQT